MDEETKKYLNLMKKKEEAKEEEPKEKPVVRERPEPTQESRIMGKYIFRDMPLFKYEVIAYAVAGFFVFSTFIFEKLGMVEDLAFKASLLAVALPCFIWFYKFLRYMPTKYRVPSLRIYKSGILELGVEDIKKGYITYGSGDNLQRKYITKLNKHTEASTGKPFLITSELKGENLNLVEGTKPDMRSEEFNAILETNTAVTTKKVMNRMLNFQQPTMQNPLFMLLVINIALVAVLIAKSFGVFEMIKGG